MEKVLEKLQKRLDDLKAEQAKDTIQVIQAMNLINNFNMLMSAIAELENAIAILNSKENTEKND